MHLLTGTYSVKFDEKGRLSLPSRLRNALETEELVVLPGLDGNYLMLMGVEYFEKKFTAPILSSPMASLDSKKRVFLRKLLAPAQYVEIDSSGRINIPQQVRKNFFLESKKEALILGTGYTIEIWNPDVYKEAQSDESLANIAEALYAEDRDDK